MKRLGFVGFGTALLLAGIALAQTSAATPLPAIYQKWLDEDVVYIAAPEERAKFLALKDDAERDRFVRQFWLRRDPTQGTEENEFKEEHYRRITYSNVHFAEKLAGWKSDRGRVYILEGPPDEIAASKNSVEMPKENWLYKNAGKTVVFEDWCRCGSFELVKPLN